MAPSKSTSSRIKVKVPPLWITYWIAFSTCIVLWDAGYCFNRPRSMPGGDLEWIWWPYNRVPYSAVDWVYGTRALEERDGFPNAQALMNLVEATLNIEYIYLRHTSPKTMSLTGGYANRPKYHAQAPLVGFASVLMTTAKTALYFLQEYYCDWCMTGQNTRRMFYQFYIATNGIWLVIPLITTIVLGRFIANAMMRDVSDQVALAEANAVAQSSVRRPEKSDFDIPVRPPRPPRPQVNPRDPPARPSDPSGFPSPTTGAAFPITYHVENINVLVVGSNRLAANRIFSLLEAGAKIYVASPHPLSSAHEEVRHRVQSDHVTFIQSEASTDQEWTSVLDAHEIKLVCVTDTLIGSGERNLDVGASISRACQSSNIPINIADHPTLSNFSFPAIHRFPGKAGPSHLQVAVSTNGHGCRLTSRIRREIVTRLPQNIGCSVDTIARLRTQAKTQRRPSRSGKRLSEEDPDTPLNEPVEQIGTPSLLSGVNKQLELPASSGEDQLRRMRWVNQVSQYYSFDALAKMSDKEADDLLSTWDMDTLTDHPNLPQHEEGILAESSSMAQKKGRILLIGSGPGHPGLLTVAAHYALKSATLILSDKLVPSEILALIPSTTTVHIAKKFPGNNEGAQNELMVQALAAARAGEIVVRLKQGDPFVYGRGGEEVLYFREHGFEATVIPGVTSAIAGPAMVGIPITQRGVAESMVMCTGVGRAGKAVSLPGYVKSRTLVILMGVARISSIISTLVSPESEGRQGSAFPPYLPIAVVERASSPDQRLIVSTLENIEAAVKSVEERPPGMMVVGWTVLALEGRGRVDVLDGVDEKEVVNDWLGGARWRVREGLDEGWVEYLQDLESV